MYQNMPTRTNRKKCEKYNCEETTRVNVVRIGGVDNKTN